MNDLVHSMNEQVHSMNIKCSYYDSFLFIVCFTTSYYVHCTSYYDSICPSLAPSALALPSAQVPEVARMLDSTNILSLTLNHCQLCKPGVQAHQSLTLVTAPAAPSTAAKAATGHLNTLTFVCTSSTPQTHFYRRRIQEAPLSSEPPPRLSHLCPSRVVSRHADDGMRPHL